MRIITIARHRAFIKELEKMLFTKQKRISIEPYLYLVTILLESIRDTKKLDLILKLIHQHKLTCKESTCSCQKSSYQLQYSQIENIIIKNKSHLSMEQFYLLYKDIIIVIENEIYNMLITICKMNKLINYCQILILHVEYICFFSMNIPFGSYLIEKNIKKIGKEMPFMLRLQLYQLKRNFINQYKKKLYHQSLGINKCIKGDNTQEKSSSQELIQYWKFYKYQKIVVGVYNLIGNCVEDFLTIISLSQIKRNALFISGGYNIASIDNYLNDKLKFEV